MTAVIMGMRLALIAVAILSVSGIKVPVDKGDKKTAQTKTVDAVEAPEKPYYHESEDGQVDSYAESPNPDQPLEGLNDEIATLATYLLPPSEDEQSDYYKPTEAGEQTDWYPIAPAAAPLPRQLLPPRQTETKPVSTEVSQSEPIYGSFRTGKLIDARGRHIPVPSRDLQPPLENAPNDYVASTSDAAINIPLEHERPVRPAGYSSNNWSGPVIAVPNNVRASLVQRPLVTKKYKNPTKLYPKKYTRTFKPVQIPINQFNEEPFIEKQKDKPLQESTPNKNHDNEYRTPSEDKRIHKFEEAQKKRNLERKPENVKVEELEISESSEDVPSLEQDTSASHYREPYRQAYSAPLRQAPKKASKNHGQSHTPPADGDRTEFRMHGMKGPHSYQFGFDTGKGKNRQFRYEERDNDGRVKGHYGYMDRNGKLRVVNYDADPEHGFRAEPPVEAE